jgi:oxygen-independent coproporphyrinogen III oxidase
MNPQEHTETGRHMSTTTTQNPDMEYIAKKYDESNVPLYLSYPTTSFWNEAPDENAFRDSYDSRTSPFLYFHFPYCKKPCYYCCCYKEVTSGDEKKRTYIGYIEKELHLKLRLLRADRITGVTQLHWGGGTPTYMSAQQIEHVWSAIGKKIGVVPGSGSCISIEAYPDPEMLPPEKLTLLRSLGFNEISFGVQDFDMRIQKTINRETAPVTVKLLAEQVKRLGFRLNIDLCYGLPFQGPAELEKTIAHVIEMSPDKIAIFPYAHYPLAFPLQKNIPASSVPGSFERLTLITRAEELFGAAGYGRIGIDHFVKPENPLFAAYSQKRAVKDFMGYSAEGRSSFIGFGNSAISFMGNRYFHNTRSLDEYYRTIDSGSIPFETNMNHSLTNDDIIRSRLIRKSILTDFYIDKKEIEAEFGIDFDSYFREETRLLADYERDGLVEHVAGAGIRVTQAGKQVARHIAYAFDKYYRN